MDVHITGLPGNPTVWEEYQQKRKGAAQTTALPGAQEMTHRRSADDIGVSVLGTAECLHADSTTSPIILTLRVPRTLARYFRHAHQYCVTEKISKEFGSIS